MGTTPTHNAIRQLDHRQKGRFLTVVLSYDGHYIQWVPTTSWMTGKDHQAGKLKNRSISKKLNSQYQILNH